MVGLNYLSVSANVAETGNSKIVTIYCLYSGNVDCKSYLYSAASSVKTEDAGAKKTEAILMEPVLSGRFKGCKVAFLFQLLKACFPMRIVEKMSVSVVSFAVNMAKLQNTGPLIYTPLNNNGIHCYILRSTKDSDTCK